MQTDQTPNTTNANQPFRYLPAAQSVPLLLIAEHAGRLLPEANDFSDQPARLNGLAGSIVPRLGLGQQDWDDHISHDVGVDQITTELAKKIGAPALLSKFSRLLVDLNRREDDATLIRQIYDRRVVSGNCQLSPQLVAARIASFYRPFHARLSELVNKLLTEHEKVMLCNIHSFTPQLVAETAKRPWHIGILCQEQDLSAQRLMQKLQADGNWVIDYNVPYPGIDEVCQTLRNYWDNVNTPNFALEIRSDILQDADTFQRLLDLLTRAISSLLAEGL